MTRFFRLFSCLSVLSRVVWGWNDPVAMYPLRGTEKDVSHCANGDVQYFDDEKTLSWPRRSPSFPVDKLKKVIRITNNDGNLKLKDLTMIIRFKASDLGMRTLAQFVAHDKPILLLSFDDHDLHFSMYLKCENKTRIKKLNVAKRSRKEHWTLVAVTYNQTSGYATLYAGDGSTHSAHWGYVNIQEPQYIYLGNNIEFMSGASNQDEQKTPENFSGKIKCFILYRRALDFSQIAKVESFCRKIVRDNDTDDGESHADDNKGNYEYNLDDFVCPTKPFDNGSRITCSDAQTLLTMSVSAGPNLTRTSIHSERTEMADNSFVPKKISSIFASSTNSVDGSNPSENMIQPGFLTPTSALASSASVETRILQFLTISSLQKLPGTQEPSKLRETLSLPLIPSASGVLLQGIITLNSATTSSTNLKDILLHSASIPKYRSEPIELSTPQQTSTATRLFLESKVTFQSAEILATGPLQIVPHSTHHQSGLIPLLPQRISTEQTSSHSVEQLSSLNLPRTTTSIYENAAILKSSMKMISKQQLSMTSTLPHKDNKTLKQIQPTRTTQRSLATSHSNNSKDFDIIFSWNEWSDWSLCNKSCGGGSRKRSRECVAESVIKNSTECNGEDVEICNTHPCRVVPLGVEAHLTDKTWDDLLLNKSSVLFKTLEAKIEENIQKMYPGKVVNITLNQCREGSVIVHFTITFRELDSDELLIFTDTADKGRIADLNVTSVSLLVAGVPTQVPEITKTYLTSATSVKVFWTPVTDGPIDGYLVAFRPINEERWGTVAVDRNTTTLHQTNLQEGKVYRIRVMAFNKSGNGLPGEAEEIMMEEEVPKVAPLVSVEDTTSPHSFAVSWKPLPEEHVMGRLLGYRITYKAIKVADERVDSEEMATMTVDSPDVLHANITGLKSYSSYVVQVAGFTSKGNGLSSVKVTGDTCRCPAVFNTNWAELPPYVTKSVHSQSPQGIIGTFVKEMLLESCGVCKAHGHTFLNFKTNGKGGAAHKTTLNEVVSDVNNKTAISFPVTGAMDDDKFQRYYVFVPMVESPGIAFITVGQKDGSKNIVISTLLKYLPLHLFCLMMAFVAGTIIWALETTRDDGFAHSFIKGAFEGFWISFTSMTTVGYGDKVLVGFWSRLFAVAWILTGLVVASVLTGALAASLTFYTIEKDVMLYGSKVTALTDSPAHRLGVRRNALIRPRGTLQEAYKSLGQGEVNGLLLDAYIAGSHSIKDLFDQQLRVKEVIKLPKGFGVVLSGEAMRLQKRVRDYIRNNAGLITKMIENSTTPLQQPEKSEAEERTTKLFSVESLLFHEVLFALLQALGAAVLCGLVLEAIHKLRARRKNALPEGHGRARLMAQRNEMLKTVQNFHESFRQLYLDLTYKSVQEFRNFEEERNRRKQSRKNT